MTPHDPSPDREPERDAWLSAALRHTPDANAAPSAELSETILRQARNAVKTPGVASTPRSGFASFWAWLARPSVATGFAGVMVATVVGVMWWDQPVDHMLPPRAEPTVADAPAEVQAPAAPPATAPAPAPTPAAKAAPAAQAQDQRRAAQARADDASRSARAKREGPVESRGAAPAAVAPSPAPQVVASPPPIITPIAPPAPAPALERERAAKPAAAAADESKASAALRDRAAEPTAAATPAPRSAAATGFALRQAESPTPLGMPAERWGWQRDGAIQTMTPALQRWLARLDRSVRWHAADTTPPADALRVQLWRDGSPHATIALGDDTVWLTPSAGAPLAATLAPANLAALREALLAATP